MPGTDGAKQRDSFDLRTTRPVNLALLRTRPNIPNAEIGIMATFTASRSRLPQSEAIFILMAHQSSKHLRNCVWRTDHSEPLGGRSRSFSASVTTISHTTGWPSGTIDR